jgi:GNAT superfamily N-acetyltransferase
MHQTGADFRCPGPFFIRPASANDLPAIVAMRDALNALELAGSPHAPIQRLSVEEFTALWGPTLADPAYCWRVVGADGEITGFGLIFVMTPRIEPLGAFLHWAYLEPTYRRQGLGQLLLGELLSWARSVGANRVELQFIEGNVAAEQFWSKNGFQPYARKCVRHLNRS